MDGADTDVVGLVGGDRSGNRPLRMRSLSIRLMLGSAASADVERGPGCCWPETGAGRGGRLPELSGGGDGWVSRLAKYALIVASAAASAANSSAVGARAMLLLLRCGAWVRSTSPGRDPGGFGATRPALALITGSWDSYIAAL